MNVVIGSDHGGFKMKSELKVYLEGLGYSVEDLGTYSEESCDYPDYAFKVAERVGAADKFPDSPVMGIVLCRSAGGVIIAANKVRNVRAVAAMDVVSAVHSREHNAANVLGLSGDWTGIDDAKKIAKAWLESAFTNEERHARRVRKIMDFEKAFK